MRERISSAHVLAVIAIVLALGGNAVAFHLGKNSVGPKQLKKNAVTTAKIKNEAITGAKVKKGSLTGAQIDASTLGTVPTARNATSAGTASVANSLATPEASHEVGSPGEPPFQNGWHNPPEGGLLVVPKVAFYKDREGEVHLEGEAEGGNGPIFQLPPGYRPGERSILIVPAVCPTCDPSGQGLSIAGPDVETFEDGQVNLLNALAETARLDGVTFRAES